MPALPIGPGTTGNSTDVFVQDSSSTSGAGLSGLVFNSSGLLCYYSFTGANAGSVSVTLVTLATTTTAWASGGFIEIDATHMKGWYRFDIPNAAVVGSVGPEVNLHFYGAANMAPCPVKLAIASPPPTTAQIATGVWQDTTSGDFTVVSSVGKSLYTSGVAPGASGGIFIAGTNAATSAATGSHWIGTVDTVTTVTNQLTGAQIAAAVLTDTGDNSTLGSPGKILSQLGLAFTTTSSSVYSTASLVNAPSGGTPPTAAAIATAVWEDTTAGGDFGTTGSIGKLIVTTGITVAAVTGNVVGSVASVTGAVGSVTGNVGGNVVGSVGSVLGNVDGNLGGSVAGNVTGSVGSVLGAVGGNVSGNVVGSVGSVVGNVGGNVAGTVASIVSPGNIWDVVNTAALHNVANSTGKQLRTVGVGTTDVIYTNTCPSQSGQTSTTIKFDSGASAVDNAYQWDVVSITGGTDAGDSRVIVSYVGATKVATVQRAWTVQPDATSVFEITPTASVSVVSYIAGQAPLQPTVAGRTLNVSSTGGSALDQTQTLAAARALDAIADTSLTVADALQCAVGSITAQVDASGGTTCVWKTASTGTTLRTKTLTLISPPATVPDKAV